MQLSQLIVMSSYLIIPGIHGQKLTDSFVEVLTQKQINLQDILVLPTEKYPPFSAFHILYFLLHSNYSSNSLKELTIISFSAGVVGAIGTAWILSQLGGKIRAFIALDGWGVPLGGNFPIYRLSHDEFTHYTSALLGTGADSFYADPPVEHLDMWRSPDIVSGWRINSQGRSPIKMIDFIMAIIT